MLSPKMFDSCNIDTYATSIDGHSSIGRLGHRECPKRSWGEAAKVAGDWLNLLLFVNTQCSADSLSNRGLPALGLLAIGVLAPERGA